MEIKLFGKSLFEARKSRAEAFMQLASIATKDSKYLPDFYTSGGNNGNPLSQYVIMDDGGGTVAIPKTIGEKKIEITPKGVHHLKLLHDETFKLNADPDYVDGQLADFKDKLNLIKSEEYDMRRGVDEISSIVTRLENRKKYHAFKVFFDQFPYTTTSKIGGVTKAHNNLKLGQIAQFIADMPREAVGIMKDYNRNTDQICGKQAVFYIIADKKDFKGTEGRRDPILLAQSPFGHFWQILGAWDEEMLFLEEL